MNDLYNIIFRRKTIRKYDKNLSISDEELSLLNSRLSNIKPLVKAVKFRYYIVKRKLTTAKRGEYCLLFYSEQKPHYLENTGYILAQMDLFMTSLDIGVCWYGIATPKETFDNELKYIIMLAFGKCHPDVFRKDIIEFKRKKLTEIWNGNFFLDIANVVRLAPSSCNFQPWRVISNNNQIKIYKYINTKSYPEKKQALYKAIDYSLIDIGIFMCFLEICLSYKGYLFERQIYQNHNYHKELDKIAIYSVHK